MKRLIQIVDDDKGVQASLTTLLSSLGWIVENFSSAIAFLRSAPHENPDLACLILDIEMPGMNGAELQETLHWQRVAFPTIILTANPDSDLSRRALDHGAHAVLCKPCDVSQLIAHINDSTGGGPA